MRAAPTLSHLVTTSWGSGPAAAAADLIKIGLDVNAGTSARSLGAQGDPLRGDAAAARSFCRRLYLAQDCWLPNCGCFIGASPD
jgi:hypothetical protein